MGVDYLDFKNRDIKYYNELTKGAKLFINNIEKNIGININFIGTGQADEDFFSITKTKALERQI